MRRLKSVLVALFAGALAVSLTGLLTAPFAGAVPTEMLGGTTFPPIGKGPYFLSLGPHGFYWFRLELQGDRPYGIERTAI